MNQNRIFSSALLEDSIHSIKTFFYTAAVKTIINNNIYIYEDTSREVNNSLVGTSLFIIIIIIIIIARNSILGRFKQVWGRVGWLVS
jgi:hypothetical protein